MVTCCILAPFPPSHASVSHPVHRLLASVTLHLWPGKVWRSVNQPATSNTFMPVIFTGTGTHYQLAAAPSAEGLIVPIKKEQFVLNCYTQSQTAKQTRRQELRSLFPAASRTLFIPDDSADCAVNHTLAPAHPPTHTRTHIHLSL